MSTLKSNLLFRVPETLRKANPEAYQPCLFHFGPYAPNFFEFRCDNEQVQVHPTVAGYRYNAEGCIKERMVMDFVGEKAMENLVNKISERSSLEEIKELYPEMPRAMEESIPENKVSWLEEIKKLYPEMPRAMVEGLPAEKGLARLFGMSAVIIVGSVLHQLEIAGVLSVRGSDGNEARMRHTNIDRLYAIEDATLMMENQIPIVLLKLACDTFVNDSDRCMRISAGNMPINTGSDLLLLVLHMCLAYTNPLDMHKHTWEPNGIKDTKQWMTENSLYKSLMAFIYDSRTGGKSNALSDSTTIHVLSANDGDHNASNKLWFGRLPYKLPSWRTVIHPSGDSTNYKSGKQNRCGSCKHDDWEERGRMIAASQLRRYGVTFVAQETDNSFKGIVYDEKSRTMTLPTMKMYDETLPYFCNLMAYELTLATEFGSEMGVQHVASYVTFLDFLIDTEEDVEVLMKAGVLRNYMERSNASVAETWDGVMRWLHVELTAEHRDIVKKLNEACKQRWRRWWASFKETYWENKPWLLFSILAAILLLILSLLQTIYTVHHE